MFHIVLYQPEIPPNTGNIIRLCANGGARLHLIRPLAFTLDDKRLQRAGLDYHEYATVRLYDDIEAFLAEVRPERLYACSTKGRRCYADVRYRPGDALIFGPESRGLPEALLRHPACDEILRIPMAADSRSLNLSNTVAIILYEAWRQQGYAGLKA